jgi:hypothetical protein
MDLPSGAASALDGPLVAAPTLGAAGTYVAGSVLVEATKARQRSTRARAKCPSRCYSAYGRLLSRRSGDVLAEQREEDIFGMRHSPWPYTQDVPLVLYGPGSIRKPWPRGARGHRADLAPTLAELSRFAAFPDATEPSCARPCCPRSEREGVPSPIFTLVWTGAATTCSSSGRTSGPSLGASW